MRPTGVQIRFLQHAANGLTTQQIADVEFYATTSVRNEFGFAYATLGATNRSHAIAILMRAGVVV